MYVLSEQKLFNMEVSDSSAIIIAASKPLSVIKVHLTVVKYMIETKANLLGGVGWGGRV